MPTFVLASTITTLYAMDVPLPVEMSALVMVGIILRVYIGRENKAHEVRDKRIAKLERDVWQQRHIKHEFRNQMTVLAGTLALALQQAAKCTCDAMTPVITPMQSAIERLARIDDEAFTPPDEETP